MSSARVGTHPSRRGNQSVASNASVASSLSSRERSSRSNGSKGTPAVESAVTRLLVSIKLLLEALAQWSKQEVSEAHVSNVYVKLGNDFNAAVAAFTSFNIDMSELLSVPEDLRSILEPCLSEDATPENLEIYLPDVRKIITNLLQGLRSKQSMYRKVVSEHQHQDEQSEYTADRTSRSSKSEYAARNAQSSRTAVEAPDTNGRRNTASSSVSAKDSPSVSVKSLPNGSGSNHFVGGFAPGINPEGDGVPSRSSTPAQRSRPKLVETNSYPSSRAQFVPPFDLPPPKQPSDDTSPSDQDATPVARPPLQAPEHVKRYSLIDRPVSLTPPPTVIIDDVASPEDETPPSEPATSPLDSAPLDAPAVQNSLAALKKSDILERRASKRFSTYNITKMTGGSIRERHAPDGNTNRRSFAASNVLSPGELAVLTEANEEEPRPFVSSPAKRQRSRGPSSRSRNPSPIHEVEEQPPLPPLPSAKALPPPPAAEAKVSEGEQPPGIAQPRPMIEEPQYSGNASPTAFPVFLQVGREVKKVMMEPGLSFSSLRVLFVDKFSYSPGQDNFPAIYIRDPASGVQYELEDMVEVKEKCLLSLNIEPLDQIKQHIDSQISSLSQDIKDLRGLVSSSNRASHPPPVMLQQPVAESTPSTARPTDRQFRSAARRLSQFIPDEMPPTIPEHIAPQMTGTSVMSDYSNRVVTDLKTQFDEVQNLRRDIGIMRQLYTEFMKQTKESLGALRTQTQTVRQLSGAKVGGARAYINDGKTKLDTRSQSVLTRMEELQDTVELIKDDVIKRNVSPKPQAIGSVRSDVVSITTELQSLKEHMQTVKPMWKKTWEEELQNIVEEQQFLQHQEELLSDLLEDHKALIEVFGHVEKVISLRGANSTRGKRTRTFKPPPMDQGHSGLSTVMLEIRGAAVDPERRLKAIEANEKNRQRDLESRTDEFQSELTGFVSAKKLKMTGGAEEAERIRQKRSEMTLKAMFSTSSPGSPSSPAITSPVLPVENDSA